MVLAKSFIHKLHFHSSCLVYMFDIPGIGLIGEHFSGIQWGYNSACFVPFFKKKYGIKVKFSTGLWLNIEFCHYTFNFIGFWTKGNGIGIFC